MRPPNSRCRSEPEKTLALPNGNALRAKEREPNNRCGPGRGAASVREA